MECEECGGCEGEVGHAFGCDAGSAGRSLGPDKSPPPIHSITLEVDHLIEILGVIHRGLLYVSRPR